MIINIAEKKMEPNSQNCTITEMPQNMETNSKNQSK